LPKQTDVFAFTDGACSGNPGPGGWGCILRCGGRERELSGGEPQTTNNRMELTAAIKALEALKYPCSVTLYSDSRYLIDAVEKGWAKSWKSRGWKRSNNKSALNSDLWETLLSLLDVHDVHFIWIEGHSGHPENERCDKLAVEQSKRFAGTNPL
jgi:ribonuclease HI